MVSKTTGFWLYSVIFSCAGMRVVLVCIKSKIARYYHLEKAESKHVISDRWLNLTVVCKIVALFYTLIKLLQQCGDKS